MKSAFSAAMNAAVDDGWNIVDKDREAGVISLEKPIGLGSSAEVLTGTVQLRKQQKGRVEIKITVNPPTSGVIGDDVKNARRDLERQVLASIYES